MNGKTANITPVHKKGDKTLSSNYRPISLLCLTAKIMERIIQQDLLDRCRDLINPLQQWILIQQIMYDKLI